MHKLYELKEKLMNELEDYSENGKYSKDDVEAIKYISSAIDHICNIVERADDEEYSMAMGRGGSSYAYDGNSYERGGSYESYARGGNRDGRSYARGRGRNARRDSMGRYSRAADDIKMQLQDIMEDAPNEQIKMEIRRLVDRMDTM